MRSAPRLAPAVASLVLGASVAFPSMAHAGTFDSFGTFQFDAAAVHKDGLESLDGNGFKNKKSDSALEGTGYVVVNSVQSFAELPVTDLPKVSGSYVLRAWLRSGRAYGGFNLSYTNGKSPDVQSNFYPTGRVTSDGWYEVETAPFSVDGTQAYSASIAMIASGAELDAVEIVPQGKFRAATACTIARDPVCGTGEFCGAGFCRDGAGSVPPLPTEAERAKLVDYFSGRLRIFFGGKYTRQNTLPKALATLATMKTATDRFTFWNGFATAIHQLRDWHTTLSGGPEAPGRGAFPVCVEEGDANLSHGLAPKDPNYPDVLVAYTGTRLTSGLKGGDRIVSVDGMHPIAWAESLDDVWWDYWHSNDPRGHAEAMENFRKLVRRFAKEMKVIRCDAVTHTCTPPETLKVADLPTEEPDYPTCDHRIRYHVAGPSEVTHDAGRGITIGKAKEAASNEALYGMIWDSVFIDNPNSNPYAAPMKTLRDNANMVILDHRTGNGGTEIAAEYLTKLFRAPKTLGFATSFNLEQDYWERFTSATGLAQFANLPKSADAYEVGDATARTDLRVALLLARDGSASDWFPLGMVGGGNNIRVFGRPTAGAFSSFFQFDYFGGLNWQFASGDYVEADGSTRIGRGVDPDEDLLPTQSDLLDGRDTVYERALAWVRTGN